MPTFSLPELQDMRARIQAWKDGTGPEPTPDELRGMLQQLRAGRVTGVSTQKAESLDELLAGIPKKEPK